MLKICIINILKLKFLSFVAMVENSQKPVFKVKVGNVDVAVWEHQTENNKLYHSVSYEKNYLDDKEEWQKTKNLIGTDIPNLQLGLQKAYEFIKIR